MTAKYEPVAIPASGVATNRARSGGRVWLVSNLIERAKGLPVFDLPLCAVNAGDRVWGPIETAYDLAKHMLRVMAVDTSSPVIMDQEGWIMDGWHRVARALFDGAATIPAVRFESTPPADYMEEE